MASFGRLFNVRPGEWKVVLLLQLQIFLIIAVLLVAKPAGNALLLSRFGAGALPYMYILTAIVAALISAAYAGALRYFSLLSVNLWSLIICLLSLLAFAVFFDYTGASDVIASGLYLWCALFGVLAASQFWMMANLVFDIRQAKRLFGFIGAGAIAGGIVGGYLANLIANSQGTRALLFVAAAMLLPCLFISIFVWKNYLDLSETSLKSQQQSANLRASPRKLIQRSKHLSLLAAIIALSVITAKLVDYQFSALAAESIVDSDRLTAFFGFWFSTFNLIGFFIQLLLTQRVVQYIGVSGALLFLPLGLSVGTFFMFLMPGLGAAIFSRLADGSLKQSLHRAAIEMLFLPLNKALKQKIKTYLDVFVDAAAGGVGGLLLILLVDGFGLSPPWISVPVLGLVMAWLVCVLLVREEYLDAFRAQLQHLQPKVQRKTLDSKHKQVIAGFLKVLESSVNATEKQVLYVLERSESVTAAGFVEPIRQLLDHPSAAVRARALRALSAQPDVDLYERVEAMLDDTNEAVSNAALAYLVTKHLSRAEPSILRQLQHKDSHKAGNALVVLLRLTRHNPSLQAKWGLHRRLQQRVTQIATLPQEAGKHWTIKLLPAACYAAPDLGQPFIREQLLSDDADICNAAIRAAGDSLDEIWLIPLIDYLSEADHRPTARQALANYGSVLLELLPTYFRDERLNISDIRRLPGVLELMPSQAAVDMLFRFMRKFYPEDMELRRECLKSLNALQRDHPEFTMPKSSVSRFTLSDINTYQKGQQNIKTQRALLAEGDHEYYEARQGLIQLLEHRLAGNFERIFRWLGLRYPPQDVIPIYRGLQSADRQQQLNALEFLDNLLEQPLKRLLIPIVEDRLKEAAPPPITRTPDVRAHLEGSQYRSFRQILGGHDQRLQLATLYLISFLSDERFGPLLGQYSQSDQPAIRDAARRALKRFRRGNMAF
ncbi:MAG: Npt1/Npt2 family nucleotide transporter [Bacteroidota bacterium]